MNFAEKIKADFEAITGLTLMYGSRDGINWAINHNALPAGFFTLIRSSNVDADGLSIKESAEVAVSVIRLSPAEEPGYETEEVIELCRQQVFAYLTALKSSGLLELRSVTRASRIFDEFDDIVCGFGVNIVVKEIDGTRCTPWEGPTLNITENGDFDTLRYGQVHVDVQGAGNIEPLTVTPTDEEQTITPTAGVDGFAPVVVGACPACPSPVLDTLSVTPSTSAQTLTPPSGTDGYDEVNVSAVTAAIDANIQPGNIKQGVSILGVVGTLEPIGIYWRAFLLSINCNSPSSSDSYMPDEITSITDDLGVVTNIGGRRIGTGVKYLNLPEAVTYGNYPLGQALDIEEVYIRKITGAIPVGGLTKLRILRTGTTSLSSASYFNNVNDLRLYECGTVTTWVVTLSGKTKLREVIVGVNTAINLPLRWSPTDVIAEGADAIAELNANIVAGLADRVADRTNDTALTITFGTSLYNVLTAETLAAFTSKNWNVAYA